MSVPILCFKYSKDHFKAGSTKFKFFMITGCLKKKTSSSKSSFFRHRLHIKSTRPLLKYNYKLKHHLKLVFLITIDVFSMPTTVALKIMAGQRSMITQFRDLNIICYILLFVFNLNIQLHIFDWLYNCTIK